MGYYCVESLCKINDRNILVCVWVYVWILVSMCYSRPPELGYKSVFWYFRFLSKKSSTAHFPLFSPHFFLYYLFSPPLSYRLSTLDWLACVWYAFISDLKFPHFCDTKSPKMGIFLKKELNYSLSSFFTPILLLPSLFANS